MKINLRSITVMLGLLAIASILVPTQTQIFASTNGEPNTLEIREQRNNSNNAEMAKMTVKEGNQPSEKEDDFELDPEENAIFVPQGKNVEVTNDVNFFRALVVQGDTDKQVPINQQGVIDLKDLDQGFYYLDVVIQDGNRKIAYEAILYIGDDNDQSRDTVNKEVNRVDKDVTITKRVTNIDKTVVCGKDQKFNDKTKKCENIPPPCKKPNVIVNGKCVPPKTPTPPITGPGGEKPTCFTTGNKPGRISTNAQTCTPFDGSPATPITGPGQIIPSVPGGPCLPGQTPARNNCVATSPPGTTFPQCITPGNPPNCVPGPDTKPGGTVGTACLTIDGKPGKVAANGACTVSAAPPSPTPRSLTPIPGSGPGESCTLTDGRPGRVTGTSAQGNLGCEPTGVGGATTAPTGPAGSDCALPGGNTGGKVTNTPSGLACIAGTTTPPTDTPTPLSPETPPEPTDTGQPRSSCTTPDGQPGMMGMGETGSLTCTPIGDQRPSISALTPTPTPPEEPQAPTDPTELANFCADNPGHSACQTPTTPPDTTSQLTPVPEPNVPDAQTETEDPDAALFGTDQPQTGGQGGTTDMPAGGGETPDIVCEGPNNPPGCTPPVPDPDTGAVCESGFGTPPNCMTQDEFCADNQDDPRCQPDTGVNGPIPSPSPLPSPGQTLADTPIDCTLEENEDDPLCETGAAERGLGGFDPTQCDPQFEVWDGTKCAPLETEQPFEQEAQTQECSDGSEIPITEVCPTDEELEADLESDESALEQSAPPADEAYDLSQDEDLGNTGDGGDGGDGGSSSDGGQGSSDLESDDSGESSDEAE